MPVDPALAGRTFPATRPVEVSSEQIAAFREAIGEAVAVDESSTPDPEGQGAVAPPTFPGIVAFAAMQDLLADPATGLSLRRIVHGDQRFVYRRPLRTGDVVRAQLTVESVRSLGGADVLGTRTEICTVEGDPVCTAYATLVHRGEDTPA